MAKSDSKRFCRALDAVAEEFGTSRAIVISWRDDDDCPFLQVAPYDLDGIRSWLNSQVDQRLFETRELERKKLELELEALRTKNSILSKDKSFWLAAAALGVVLTRELREWLDHNEELEREPIYKITVHRIPDSVVQNFDLIAREKNKSRAYMAKLALLYALDNRKLFNGLDYAVGNQENIIFCGPISRRIINEVDNWLGTLQVSLRSTLVRGVIIRYVDLHKL